MRHYYNPIHNILTLIASLKQDRRYRRGNRSPLGFELSSRNEEVSEDNSSIKISRKEKKKLLPIKLQEV
jgi:hypothetical protein